MLWIWLWGDWEGFLAMLLLAIPAGCYHDFVE